MTNCQTDYDCKDENNDTLTTNTWQVSHLLEKVSIPPSFQVSVYKVNILNMSLRPVCAHSLFKTLVRPKIKKCKANLGTVMQIDFTAQVAQIGESGGFLK